MRAPEALDLPFAVPAALRGHRTVIAAVARDDNGQPYDLLVTRSPAGQAFYAAHGEVRAIAASQLPFLRDTVALVAGDRASRVVYVCGGLI